MRKSVRPKVRSGGLARLSAILLSALVSVVFIHQLEAATYYVAVTGSDASPGTESQPFRSIARGLSVLSAGDRLYVKSGTYGEAVNSNSRRIPSGSSWSAPVTIAAYPGHSVVVRPGGGGEVFNLAHSYIRYLEIDGLIIDAANAGFGISLTNGANRVRFRNVEVKNAVKSGVLVSNGSGGTEFNEFINMKVHHNGSGRLDHGLYIATSNNTVERSEIYSNSGYGVHVFNSASGQRANQNVVRYNRIYGNGSYGMILTSGNNNLAHDNLVWGNKTGGIEVQWQGSSNTRIYNNAVYANGGNGIEIGADSSSARIINNIVYQNANAIVNRGSGTLISNNLTSDPKFVNPGGADFSLQSGSPAIDKGMSLPELRLDFNGFARPQGIAMDIGAHEYKGSGGVVTAPASTLPAAPENLRVDVQ